LVREEAVKAALAMATAMARAVDAGGGEGDAAKYGGSVLSSGEGGTLLMEAVWRRGTAVLRAVHAAGAAGRG
jgi:hypothetical protein